MQATAEYVVCPCGTDVPVDQALDGHWCSTTCKEDPDVTDHSIDGRGPWMTTFTGKRFYPEDPKPEDITIEDLAHALANTCRWGGHTDVFYSVAQHSVLTSLVADRPYRRGMLLHDGAEAYVGDLPRPLKRGTEMGKLFTVMEDRIQEAILAALNTEQVPKQLSVQWDNRVLLAEADDLINQDWVEALRDRVKVARFPEGDRIQPMAPALAERFFLNRWMELA